MELIRLALERKSFALDFHGYGHLYFNIVLIPLSLIQLIAPVSDEMIIVALRLVSMSALLLTVLATFFLARRFIDRVAAPFAAALVACVPLSLLDISASSHPDSLQLLLVMLSLYSCCEYLESRTMGPLMKAALWAGLSFSAKYSGLFLVPIIASLLPLRGGTQGYSERVALPEWLFRAVLGLGGVLAIVIAGGFTPEFVHTHFNPNFALNASQLKVLRLARQGVAVIGAVSLLLSILPWIWSVLRKKREFLVMATEYCMLGAAFLLAFAATSPYLLADLRVVKGLLAEARHVSYGHAFAAEGSALEWLRIMGSGEALGFAVTALFGLTLLAGIVALVRTRRLVWEPHVILWTWTLFYLSYLFIRVNYREPRYLLPIVPVVLILVSSQAVRWRRRLPGAGRSIYGRVASVVLIISFGTVVAGGMSRARSFRENRVREAVESREVAGGNWLAANYGPETRIAHDPYCYVPPTFEDVRRSWFWTISDRDRFGPELIVVHGQMSSRFSDPLKAMTFYHGASKYREIQSYYSALTNEEGYSLVEDFGPVRIYARNLK